ncbi:octaprenyl-diphosphate synthase [Phycisphaerales bacterium]|nr:octaprenyl-diphosphate synthase [Phycisphaerales bacterium]
MNSGGRSVTDLLDLPADLTAVSAEVVRALDEVARVFDRHLMSDLPPVSRLCRHVERYRGKMVRPTLTILAGLAAHPYAGARAESDLLTTDHFKVAAVCEMVHMATLVHDDVLDEADTRRRGATVNALHGNEAAVMLGDYLIASAYHLCSTLPDNRASLAVGRASVLMCSGELLQLHHREDWSLDEPTYFEVVDRKTGELIAASAALGAVCSGASESVCRAVEGYARDVGVAFQVQDDLLDLLGEERVVGKTVGRDLQKGKLTLPLIHHLAAADPETRGWTLRTLESARRREHEHEPVGVGAMVLRAVQRTGSIEYSRKAAANLVDRAKQRLAVLPATPARTMLERLADAVVTRAY